MSSKRRFGVRPGHGAASIALEETIAPIPTLTQHFAEHGQTLFVQLGNAALGDPHFPGDVLERDLPDVVGDEDVAAPLGNPQVLWPPSRYGAGSTHWARNQEPQQTIEGNYSVILNGHGVADSLAAQSPPMKV